MSVRLTSLRLLLPSVVLPALIVAADQALLAMMQGYGWSGPMTLVIMGWFVVQTGLLAYVCGRWLPNWGWRLLVLGWAMLLIDLLLMDAATKGRQIMALLALAFFSGQLGAAVTWTTLGTLSLGRRLLLGVAAATPAVFVSRIAAVSLFYQSTTYSYESDAWKLIVLIQAVGTCALAAALWACGYRIEPMGVSLKAAASGFIQFSIRQLFVVTTAVGILICIVQNMALLLSGRQWLHAAVDGVVLALVSLTALWAALGVGRWWVKLTVFALLVFSAGASLRWIEFSILHPVDWTATPFKSQMTYADWWWVAWTSLTGSFLAAMLLVLRAAGYRLVRRRR